MKNGTFRRLTAGLFAALIIGAGVAVVAQVAFYQRIILTGPCQLSAGSGTPEGAFLGSPCDLFLRTNGGAGTILYIKETGAATNTGWVAVPPGGTIPVGSGGTGITSYTIGDLIQASAPTTLAKLASVAAGSYLRSGGVGTVSVWSTLLLPNAAAQGEVLTATAANTVTALGVGAAGDYLRSGGAGANVSWRSPAYGDMFLYDNAAALTIDTVNVYHGVTGMSSGTLAGFTHGASLDGVIASVAEGVPADGKVTVTDVAHGLTTGDVITQHGTTDYDGTFVITKLTDDTYEITKAWTVTRTGFWHRPCRLIAGASAAGPYRLCWNVSLNAAANGKRFKLESNVGIAATDNIVAEYQAGVNTSWQTVGACGIVTIAASDQIWLSIKGLTDATDVTIVHANLNLQRIGG